MTVITEVETSPIVAPDLVEDPIADLLEKAERELRNRGWCRYRMMNSLGQVCVAGAVLAATGGDADGLYIYAFAALSQTVSGSVMGWNDTKSRTESEVHELLLRTAAEHRRNVASSG